jgi:hypothetical protein
MIFSCSPTAFSLLAPIKKRRDLAGAGLLAASVRLPYVVSRLIDAAVARRQTDFMDDAEMQDTIANVIDRLAARYPDTPLTLIARVVAEEYDALGASRIRTYIPTLVEHGARNRINREVAAGTVEV